MKLRNNKADSHTTFPAAYALLLALLVSSSVHAADDNISTDRPDFVESSNVVGKGHAQIETSVAFERNSDAGVRERTRSTPTLLRVGMGDSAELRIESDGLMRTSVAGEPTVKGNADAAIGIKWHLRDEQGAMPSLGFLLHADLPSGSAPLRGHGVRPSARVAAEWELPSDFALGVMPGLAYESDEQGKRYTSGIFGVVLGKEINDRLRGFVEIAAPQIARARHGGNIVTFDTGVAYLLTPNCQIDTAISRGLTTRTPELSWTVGLSFKL